MQLYSAFDLHANTGHLRIIDHKGLGVLRRKLPNDIEAIFEVLAPYRRRMKGVIVESKYNWYWLVDGLMEHGFRVPLAEIRVQSRSIPALSMPTMSMTPSGWLNSCV